jgi:hypothetical protein
MLLKGVQMGFKGGAPMSLILKLLLRVQLLLHSRTHWRFHILAVMLEEEVKKKDPMLGYVSTSTTHIDPHG